MGYPDLTPIKVFFKIEHGALTCAINPSILFRIDGVMERNILPPGGSFLYPSRIIQRAVISLPNWKRIGQRDYFGFRPLDFNSVGDWEAVSRPWRSTEETKEEFLNSIELETSVRRSYRPDMGDRLEKIGEMGQLADYYYQTRINITPYMIIHQDGSKEPYDDIARDYIHNFNRNQQKK